MYTELEKSVPPAADPLAYNIAALVKSTSLSRALIYEHIKDGLLKVTKVGRRTIIMREDALNWLASLQA